MTRIVLGIATSHGPLLNLEGALWEPYSQQIDFKRKNLYDPDGEVHPSYESLAQKYGDRFAELAKPERLNQQAVTAQKALDRLSVALSEAHLDAVVIVGDDQQELFTMANNPALSIFYGNKIVSHVVEAKDSIWQIIHRGYGMDTPRTFEGAPKLAYELIERLVEQGFDVAAAAEVENPQIAGFGHAFGFIVTRLMGEKKIPIVPVLLNTYYPPNQPSPARCFALGQALTNAIESNQDDMRVAVIASGGLSHHVTNEALDRVIMTAIKANDGNRLKQLPVRDLNGGTSEVRCWITTAGACEHLKVVWDEYIPVYRTPAGTGIGLGFACWS